MEAQTHKPQQPTNSQHLTTPPSPPPPPPPPPSSVTSPSHEFSFTNPFNSANTIKCTGPAIAEEAVDFSPADDIFYHGHLLPLHPTIPLRLSDDILCAENLTRNLGRVDSDRNLKCNADNEDCNNAEAKERTKGKASLASVIFGLAKLKVSRHGSCEGEQRVVDEKRAKKRKGFDVKKLLSKYLGMMDAVFRMKRSRELRRQPHSFSGRSNRRDCEKYSRGRSAQFSAPASTRTSPTNSGLLCVSSGTFSTADDSTMEELKSAIQAAIAHCKKSVDVEDRQCK